MKWGVYYLIVLLTGLAATAVADEIVHGFKNPSLVELVLPLITLL